MNAAGYILAGMRKYRRRAHPPMILCHGLTTDFFGIEERADSWPDFEFLTVWPATARLLWGLRDLDRLAGQTSLADCGHWKDPATGRMILCTKKEAKREHYERKA